jgi:hypothetical protein
MDSGDEIGEHNYAKKGRDKLGGKYATQSSLEQIV